MRDHLGGFFPPSLSCRDDFLSHCFLPLPSLPGARKSDTGKPRRRRHITNGMGNEKFRRKKIVGLLQERAVLWLFKRLSVPRSNDISPCLFPKLILAGISFFFVFPVRKGLFLVGPFWGAFSPFAWVVVLFLAWSPHNACHAPSFKQEGGRESKKVVASSVFPEDSFRQRS